MNKWVETFWKIIELLFTVGYSDDKRYKIAYIFGFKLKFRRHSFNWYLSEKDNIRINEYLKYKTTRRAKGVVYTCTTNDYDDINEIKIYKYIDKDWDYVFFTDNNEYIKLGQIGIWEVRPLQFKNLDNTRNQRWHKINPHLLFPDYEKSIWLDASMVIKTKKIFDIAYNMQNCIMLPKHYKNNCIYQEYKDVLKLNLDSYDIINKELDFIKQANMPKHFGFSETNVLVRKHNVELMTKFDEEWWSFILNYSKRDQLSFMYLVWKYGFEAKKITFKNTRIDPKNFFIMSHKKGREPVENNYSQHKECTK